MAQFPSKNNLIGGIDLDNDELRVGQQSTVFQKGLKNDISKNTESSTGQGSNFNVLTPFEGSNSRDDFDFPAGNNFVIGTFESQKTNELYVFVYNSANNHFIYRIRGNDGVSEIVYQGACLNFQYNPRHTISEGRCALEVTCVFDKVLNQDVSVKYLIFTDGYNPQRFISVEDAIATNSYNGTDFPYFNKAGYRPCDIINLGIPYPMDCIAIEEVPNDEEDELQNNLNYFGWQWRVKFIDIFGRESEHGIISDMYFTLVGGKCIAGSNGLTRCVNLTFDSGNPLVNKIIIEFRKDSGNNVASVTDADWYQYDTIDKWNNCENVRWYEREINPDLNYNAVTNTITYTFCGDKLCQPIPQSETSRTENPMPKISSGLVSLQNNLLLSNNIRGFEPLKCEELSKISYYVTPPSGSDCTVTALRKIIIYAEVYSVFDGVTAPSRYYNGKAGWGQANGPKNNFVAYDQVFADGQEGWIGYLAGTPYKAVSKQVLYFPGAPWTSGQVKPLTDQTNFQFFWQRWEFDVPPGEYIFRIANHQAKLSDGDYQKTSTYVAGKSVLSTAKTNTFTEQYVKELVINVCEGDHLSENDADCLIIWDLTTNDKLPIVGTNASTLLDGYLYEDQVSNIPIEMCFIDTSGTSGEQHDGGFTDHNGFYFSAGIKKKQQVSFDYDTCSDGTKTVESEEAIDNFNAGGHLKHDKLYLYTGENEFPEAGHRIIEGDILLCDNPDIGVGGVLVLLTKCQWVITDANGHYRLIAHNRTGSFSIPPANQDDVIFSQRGGCQLLQCGEGCVYCFPHFTVDYQACTGEPRITTLDDLEAYVLGTNNYGPQTGGRYGLGIIMYDFMGRHSFVQADESHFVNIPSLVQTKVFAFSTINFDMTGITFPDEIRKVMFCITENLNQQDFLNWSADKVEFVDGGGNINNAAPTQIRVYIGSIAEYNLQNNFNTNANWQFLYNGEDGDATPSITDTVQFILNGNGQWYSVPITALVKYEKQGTYFVIDYVDELKDLKEGALFKFIRQKDCQTNHIYYEICPVINVTNGIPDVVTGSFNYFDSYFIGRDIPIPTFTTTNGVTTKTVDVKSYPYFYEHPSPSDFWGTHCANRGRINIKNPNEREQCLGSEVALSGPINSRSTYNGLGYFTDADTKLFSEQEWGNIVVILPEINTLLAICENNNFIVGYNDTLLRLNNDNQVTAPSAPNLFGEPQRKIGGDYGCQPADINTIRKRQGIVVFLDRNKASLIFHDYSNALDASVPREGKPGYKSYLNAKIAAINLQNKVPLPSYLFYFYGGIDPKYNEYYLTCHAQPVLLGGEPVPVSLYINNQQDIVPAGVETICVSMDTGILKAFPAFAPEYYGKLEGYYTGKNMFTFSNGHWWSHRGVVGQTQVFNKFFGVQTKKIITIVTNISPEKVKKFLYNEVYCRQHKFVCPVIVTETEQESRLLAVWWENRERFWCAEFLCDLNTFQDPNLPIIATAPLTDGDVLYGRWLKATYISEDADDAEYAELEAIVTYVTSTEKSAD